VLRELAGQAPPASRAGLKARLLAQDLEQNVGRFQPPPASTGAGPTAPPREPEERAFQELLMRARDSAAQRRYGEALATLRELPASLRTAQFLERATAEAATLDGQAKTAYADLSLEAEKAFGEGKRAKARELYEVVTTRFGIPRFAEAAAARLRVIAAAEEKDRDEGEAARNQRLKAAEMQAAGEALARAADCAGVFRHVEAREALAAALKPLQDQEAREVLAEATRLLGEEEWLFEPQIELAQVETPLASNSFAK
jgi:hypothetical protein